MVLFNAIRLHVFLFSRLNLQILLKMSRLRSRTKKVSVSCGRSIQVVLTDPGDPERL